MISPALPPPPPPSSGDADEDKTVQRPRRQASVAATINLIGDDGRLYQVGGRALVGRSPTATAAHGTVNLVVIDDDSRSMSKTHAVLRYDDGRLFVIDRQSTNGTAIANSHGAVRIGSDSWAEVFAGEYLMFGDRWCYVGAGLGERPTDRPLGVGAPPAGVSGAMLCGQCGSGVGVIELFCKKCGTAIPGRSEHSSGAQLPPPPVADVEPSPPPPSVAPAEPTTGEASRRKRRRRRRDRDRRQPAAAPNSGGNGPPHARRSPAVALVILAVVGAAALAVRTIWSTGDGEQSDLPRLASSVDQPEWTATLDGFVGGPVSDGGDVFLTGRSEGDDRAVLYRLARSDGTEVWATELGSGDAHVAAVVGDRVIVTLGGHDGAPVLGGFDADDGAGLWETSPEYDRLVVADGNVYLLSQSEVQLLETASGDTTAVGGDTAVLSGDDVLVTEGRNVTIHDAGDLSQRLGPVALPAEASSVTFDGRTVFATVGDDIVALDEDGDERVVVDSGVDAVTGIVPVPLSPDRLLVAHERGYVAIAVTDEGDGGAAVTEILAVDSIDGIIEDGDDIYLVVPDADGITVYRAADGEPVLTAAAAGQPVNGHLLVQGEHALAAFSLEGGDEVWSLGTDGHTPWVVDGAIALTAHSASDDKTELRFYE